MTFEKRNDFYVTTTLDHIDQDIYKTKLLSPIEIRPGESVFAALCNISYMSEYNSFQNLSNAAIDIAIPRFCKEEDEIRPPRSVISEAAPGLELGRDLLQAVNLDQELSQFSTSKLKFIRCRLENGEYSGETLCDALNSEIQSKMPSAFDPNQCRFIYNNIIDRIELRIDGSPIIAAEDRCTLVVYAPLSHYMGFTSTVDRQSSFCFVSINIE